MYSPFPLIFQTGTKLHVLASWTDVSSEQTTAWEGFQNVLEGSSLVPITSSINIYCWGPLFVGQCGYARAAREYGGVPHQGAGRGGRFQSLLSP